MNQTDKQDSFEEYENNKLVASMEYLYPDLDYINNKIKYIEAMYEHYQVGLWSKIGEERPSLTRKVLDCRDKIDLEWNKYHKGKSSAEKIHQRLSDYWCAWVEISKRYK